jgi:hypothetical protein
MHQCAHMFSLTVDSKLGKQHNRIMFTQPLPLHCNDSFHIVSELCLPSITCFIAQCRYNQQKQKSDNTYRRGILTDTKVNPDLRNREKFSLFQKTSRNFILLSYQRLD